MKYLLLPAAAFLALVAGCEFVTNANSGPKKYTPSIEITNVPWSFVERKVQIFVQQNIGPATSGDIAQVTGSLTNWSNFTAKLKTINNESDDKTFTGPVSLSFLVIIDCNGNSSTYDSLIDVYDNSHYKGIGFSEMATHLVIDYATLDKRS